MTSASSIPLVGTAFDPREQDFDRFNAWYGEPELDQLTFFANAGTDLGNGASLYGWASYQNRDARSAGFFRRALDDRNVIEIYPDGFLPIIAPEVDRLQCRGGVTWKLGEWDMDTSLVYGRNEMEFTIENTLNRSLGTASGTKFDAGGFDVRPARVQLLRRAPGGDERAGLSAQHRGRHRSAATKPTRSPQANQTRTATAAFCCRAARPTQSGAQVFPGLPPSQRGGRGSQRRSASTSTSKPTSRTNCSALPPCAYEDYSDFGDNVSGKLAARYDFTESFALRGSLQNGFRAPSLQQQYFATTSTNFINGVPFDITTFPATDPVAQALGAQPLDAEKSDQLSRSAPCSASTRSNLTIDAYRIDIDDRIVLSENLTQTNVRDYLQGLGFIGVGGGRFFINGVDTETNGVDVVVNWPWDTDTAGHFDFTLAGNYTTTEVTKVPQTAAELAALSPPPPLFDRINVLSSKKARRRTSSPIVNWTLDQFGGTLRATHYGEVLEPGTTAALDFTLGSETLVDAGRPLRRHGEHQDLTWGVTP